MTFNPMSITCNVLLRSDLCLFSFQPLNSFVIILLQVPGEDKSFHKNHISGSALKKKKKLFFTETLVSNRGYWSDEVCVCVCEPSFF